MAIRNILTIPDEGLTKKSHKVTKFDERLCRLIDDMKDTLDKARGVGLAAPQVGVLRCVAIVEGDEGLIELVNPEIICEDGEQDDVEGCLSVPGQCGYVKRPMKVTVRAQDRNGEFFEITGEGLTARAFCHEIDHLKGQVFLPLVSEFVDIDDIKDEDEGEDDGQ